MNFTEAWKEQRKGRFSLKWSQFFYAYDRHFARFKDKKVNVLELGVAQGGSLQLWKRYFGRDSNIFGLDKNPDCKNVEEDRIKVFIGDQLDSNFVHEVFSSIGRVDIVIDDASHDGEDQLNTFKLIFPMIPTGSVYSCEDLFVSYQNIGTNLFVDFINSELVERMTFNNDRSCGVSCVSVYPGLVIMEKEDIKVSRIKTGRRYDLR